MIDRLPGESAPAYEAFKLYAEGGVDRSIQKVARRLSKCVPLLKRWSTRHRWVERAAAFDSRLAEIGRKAEEQKIAQQAGLWARRMVESREEAFQMAGKLIAKAQAMLDYPLAQTTSADGKTTVKPARWNFSDAARMADVAARLKQLATGLPTERKVTLNLFPLRK